MYRQEVQSLVEAVHDILDEYAPLEALRVWFLRLADFVRVRHGHGLSLERWIRRRWRTTSAARDNRGPPAVSDTSFLPAIGAQSLDQFNNVR